MISREESIKKAYGGIFPERSLKAAEILEEKLAEDLMPTGDIPYGAITGDITSDTVLKHNRPVYGIIKAKGEGIIAGLEEVMEFYARHGVQVVPRKQDGEQIRSGEIIAELYSNEKEFLKVERTGLNMLQRMSGIATATKKLSDIANKYGVKIVGTRKTLLNYLDKKAIEIGGGLAHRMGLYDAVLIKDNHLEAIREEGIENAIETSLERVYWSRYRNHANFIEIEISTLEEAVRAAEKWKELYEKARDTSIPFIIMFDNMKPSEIKRTIKTLKKQGLYDYVLFEASGGITEKTLKQYAASGVDVISTGAVTHSVKALDISQKIVKREK